MWIDIACEALRVGKVLELRYDGYNRCVEVHAVGYSRANHAVMRVWQLRGGSVSNERQGWKLMRLDEATGARIVDEESLAPRLGYRSGDKDMVQIVCELR
ncbi:hypothetical protein [Lysobacter antibioticus]|uniref:hypothetical protein n=1 Tax=Lysobacter antibioticus TaxID=84531 RepID=UPI00094EF982|nr:hypothetical protein [Lysobacter antibioticus]